VAHGSHCVARHEGRVVFVRHALPGELVRVRVTGDHGGYLRADAIEVLRASADRTEAPCEYAAPGRCGGCDWQHVRPDAQRQLKADVVCELFSRMAGLDVRALLGDVGELPGGALHWRTRIEYAVSAAGTVGLRRHRSHEIEPVRRCLLGAAGVDHAPTVQPAWRGVTGVSLVLGDDAEVSVLVHRPGPGRQARGRRPPDRVELVAGQARLSRHVGEHELQVSADGFWQVHPAAVMTYGEIVHAWLSPQAGETVLELYAGAGALTVTLAHAVGQTGRVVAVEASRSAVADATQNLRHWPWAQVIRARVDADAIAALDVQPDLVVLDPPRAGAGAATMQALLDLAPRALAYIACDPASLARDVATARSAGWELAALRAFDAFPMTHHVECIALLRPTR